MKLSAAFYIALVLAFCSCTKKKPVDRMSDVQLRAYADHLAHEYIITDGHVDLPDHLLGKKFDPENNSYQIILSTDSGDFDYNRAKKGGLDAPFMSIYVPKEFQSRPDHGKQRADSLMQIVRGIVLHMPDKFALANSVEDVEKNFIEGKISLPMGMENGAPIGNDIKNIQYFFDQGIRYITLTHNQDNQICNSSRDTTHTWNGLSPYGREVVKEMNRLGILIDISHVDDSTFYQVMKLSKAPCIASHSSCRKFAPSVMRDMTDDMIRKMGENGGVIMLNFYTSFLNEDVWRLNRKLDSLLSSRNLKESDPTAQSLINQFRIENPQPRTDVASVADHMDWVVKLAGIDHVGLGSDYDGVGGPGNLPEGLKDVSCYPNLIYELLRRGYTEEDIQKICSGNLFRVWRKVAAVASGQSF